MEIVTGKHNFVYTFGLCVILFLIFPRLTLAQTTNPSNNSATFSLSIEETPIYVGDTFTLHLNAENVTDLAGWQCNILFDPNVLEAIEVNEGDFLNKDGESTLFLENTIDNTIGKITELGVARISKDGVSGTGKLVSVTFMAKAIGEVQVTLTNLKAGLRIVSETGVLETTPLSISSVPMIVITVEEQPELNENGPRFSFSTDPTSILLGDTFTLHLNAENFADLAAWQCNILFDPNVLEAIEVNEGDFLNKDGGSTFFLENTIDNTAGKITKLGSARISKGGVSGTGKLVSVTFVAKTIGETQITLNNLKASTSHISETTGTFETIPLSIPEIMITVEEQPELNESDPGFSFSIDTTSILIGDTFTLYLNANEINNLARWQCGIVFDPNILEATEVVEGDFLKEGDATTFFLESTIDNTAGKITGLDAVRLSRDGVSGTGKLLSVTFVAKAVGEVQVTLTNLSAYSSESVAIPLSIPEIAITVSDVERANLFFSIDELPVRVNDTFTLHLNVEDATDLAGWLCDIVFDPAALEAVEVSEGDFLKKDGGTTYFLENTIDNTTGKITRLGAISLGRNGISGTGRLLSVTFTAKTIGEAQVTLANLFASSSDLVIMPLSIPDFVITVEERVFLPWDVNQDGQVSVLDLMYVAQYLREDASVNPQSDVNNDGTIGILDLIAIAQHIGETPASAPILITARGVNMNPIATNNGELTPALIQAWITHAQEENDGSIVFRKGIANLQRLLASLVPEKTKLLANYPNPFNPETWIPYHLAEAAEVTLTIFSANGKIVKTLVLGYQDAGVYKSRSRAAYWDGRNSIGEPVASGIYFYTLTAGDFTATRKMLIRK